LCQEEILIRGKKGGEPVAHRARRRGSKQQQKLFGERGRVPPSTGTNSNSKYFTQIGERVIRGARERGGFEIEAPHSNGPSGLEGTKCRMEGAREEKGLNKRYGGVKKRIMKRTALQPGSRKGKKPEDNGANAITCNEHGKKGYQESAKD